MADFEKYLTARFADDHHVWGTVLFEEVTALGYAQSYPTFVRQIRTRGLRPHCEACRGVVGRDAVEIDRPPGEEIQWDWFERRRAPWGGTAYVLLGTLPHSSRTRGVLAESMDQAHLIEAMDGVLRRLGGTSRIWRTDRLATVIRPGTKDVQASFARVAKHYGAVVDRVRPGGATAKGRSRPRCGSRRAGGGAPSAPPVLKRPKPVSTGSWPGQAECPGTAHAHRSEDDRRRVGRSGAAVGPAGTPSPATITVTRPVDDNATVAFRGNRYSVPPGLSGVVLELRHRLASSTLEIHATSGALLATHRLAPSRSRPSCAPPSTGLPSSRSSCRASPPHGRATPRPTGHRAPSHWPKRPGCWAPRVEK